MFRLQTLSTNALLMDLRNFAVQPAIASDRKSRLLRGIGQSVALGKQNLCTIRRTTKARASRPLENVKRIYFVSSSANT